MAEDDYQAEDTLMILFGRCVHCWFESSHGTFDNTDRLILQGTPCKIDELKLVCVPYCILPLDFLLDSSAVSMEETQWLRLPVSGSIGRHLPKVILGKLLPRNFISGETPPSNVCHLTRLAGRCIVQQGF